MSSDEAILEKWAQFFEELLQHNTPEQVEGLNLDQDQGILGAEESEPTIKEVEQAIKRESSFRHDGGWTCCCGDGDRHCYVSGQNWRIRAMEENGQGCTSERTGQ